MTDSQSDDERERELFARMDTDDNWLPQRAECRFLRRRLEEARAATRDARKQVFKAFEALAAHDAQQEENVTMSQDEYLRRHLEANACLSLTAPDPRPSGGPSPGDATGERPDVYDLARGNVPVAPPDAFEGPAGRIVVEIRALADAIERKFLGGPTDD